MRHIPHKYQVKPPTHPIGGSSQTGQRVGLGDIVKKVTTSMGIRPCKGCERRARQLNRLLPIVIGALFFLG
ncbi:MAG TPA: hypothetical protein VNU72_02955 [Puia sp.]|nr:hypothetical protein [Puia sp.]